MGNEAGMVGDRLLRLQEEWQHATQARALFGERATGRDPQVIAVDYETTLRDLLSR